MTNGGRSGDPIQRYARGHMWPYIITAVIIVPLLVIAFIRVRK